MAEGQQSFDAGSSRTLYPALAVAAIAGLAVTYFFVARRSKGGEAQLPLEKVVNLCNSAADKLDAFLAHSLAG